MGLAWRQQDFLRELVHLGRAPEWESDQEGHHAEQPGPGLAADPGRPNYKGHDQAEEPAANRVFFWLDRLDMVWSEWVIT